MFENIILATDLSPAWDEVVACAAEFKALGCKKVVLAHVITVKFLGGLEASLQAEAQPKLEEQQRALAAQGFQVTTEMPLGLPAYSLNDVARRQGAGLIVVGSHGKSLWREGVLGSVSSAILHHTEFPTLLLNITVTEAKPAGTCRLNATDMLRHVLVPTDFSDIADRALAYVERLVPKGVGRVTLLHAIEVPGGETYPPGFEEMALAQAEELLAPLKERLQAAGAAAVDLVYAEGHPLKLILETLRQTDISLIVMGTQGKGFLKEVFLGSVAHNVTRLAPCPVLLIPPVSR